MRDLGSKLRTTTVLTHVLCIGILFIVPEVLTTLAWPTKPVQPWLYTKTAVYILVFYVNYYVIIDRSIGRPHRGWRFVVWNIVLVAVALTVLYLIWRFKGHMPHPRRGHHAEGVYIARWIGFVYRDLVMLVLVIGLAMAIRLGDKWMKLDRRQKDLVNSQREEELKNLKSQLNPHFLFNTLNTIYALISISPDKAQGAVHKLSHLLRYALYARPDSVTLRQETDFIADYVALMRLRLPSSLTFDIRIDPGPMADMKIAPLLFIAPVENVFKHGIHTPEIPICISLTAGADGSVTLTTSNGIPPEETSCSDADVGGIGLSNLRRRLHLIYGDDARLNTERADGRFLLTLSIKTLPPSKP